MKIKEKMYAWSLNKLYNKSTKGKENDHLQ